MTKFLLVLALVGCAHTYPWRSHDTASQIVVTATLTGDWLQTRHITANCSESNPVVGWCGEKFPVSLYFPLVIAGHAVVSYSLDQPYRAVWQAAFIFVESVVVWNNWRDGYGFQN